MTTLINTQRFTLNIYSYVNFWNMKILTKIMHTSRTKQYQDDQKLYLPMPSLLVQC